MVYLISAILSSIYHLSKFPHAIPDHFWLIPLKPNRKTLAACEEPE